MSCTTKGGVMLGCCGADEGYDWSCMRAVLRLSLGSNTPYRGGGFSNIFPVLSEMRAAIMDVEWSTIRQALAGMTIPFPLEGAVIASEWNAVTKTMSPWIFRAVSLEDTMMCYAESFAGWEQDCPDGRNSQWRIKIYRTRLMNYANVLGGYEQRAVMVEPCSYKQRVWQNPQEEGPQAGGPESCQSLPAEKITYIDPPEIQAYAYQDLDQTVDFYVGHIHAKGRPGIDYGFPSLNVLGGLLTLEDCCNPAP